jgi:hypothetical protein
MLTNIRAFLVIVIGISTIMMSAYSTQLFADDKPKLQDSSRLGPIDLTADPGRGFVLTRGSHQMYCGGRDGSYWGCNFSVSSTQCPAGFTPEAMFAQRWNKYVGECPLRAYLLDDPKPYPNGSGGYSVTFHTAYANFVMCEDRNITVTYTIMCIRTT